MFHSNVYYVFTKKNIICCNLLDSEVTDDNAPSQGDERERTRQERETTRQSKLTEVELATFQTGEPAEEELPDFVGDEPDPNIAKKIFASKRDQFHLEKGVAGSITGLLSGGILFALLALSFKMPFNIAAYISVGMALIFSLGLAFSSGFRCAALLLVPSLATGNGRTAVMAIIIGLLLTGPGKNISDNALQISTSMSCSTNMIYNQTIDLKQKLTEPINNITDKFEETIETVKKIGKDIQKLFGPVNSVVNAFHSGAAALTSALTV